MIKDFFQKLWTFKRTGEGSVRNTIEELIEGNEEGEASLDPEEKTLLTNILNLRDICVWDIMVPRADIQAVPLDISYEMLSGKLSTLHHTRIPVFRETLDEVQGFIHVKDILEFSASPSAFECRKILRDILFVSPSMRLLDLLLQMKVASLPLALVVDEYGGIDGLVTTWDIIKEFLGDLSTDSEEQNRPELTRLSDHSILTEGRLPLEILHKEFSIKFKKEDSDDVETVGGLIFSLLGRIPAKHELIKHPKGLTFEILDVDPRRIKKVRIYHSKLLLPHENSSTS